MKRKIERELEEENENLKEKFEKRKGNKSQQVLTWREKNRERYLGRKEEETKRRRNQREETDKRDNEGCVEEVRISD